jgi:uncharacterized protein (TIGR02246 family)
MRRLHLGLVAVVVGLLSLVRARSKAPAPRPGEEDALKKLGRAYLEAFNRGDASAVAAFYAADADFIPETGEPVRGRADIEKGLTQMFARAKKIEMQVTPGGHRFVTPELVICDGAWEVIGSRLDRPARGRYFSVLVKRDGRWLILCHRSMVPISLPKP